MKKPPFVALVLVGVVMLAAATLVRAQDPVTAHVPFAFLVDGRLLPAGDYRVEPSTDPAERVLQIVSRDGRREAFTIYEDSGARPRAGAAALEFKKVGNDYVLWRVNEPGTGTFDVPLQASIAAEARLARAAAEKAHRGN